MMEEQLGHIDGFLSVFCATEGRTGHRIGAVLDDDEFTVFNPLQQP